MLALYPFVRVVARVCATCFHVCTCLLYILLYNVCTFCLRGFVQMNIFLVAQVTTRDSKCVSGLKHPLLTSELGGG